MSFFFLFVLLSFHFFPPPAIENVGKLINLFGGTVGLKIFKIHLENFTVREPMWHVETYYSSPHTIITNRIELLSLSFFLFYVFIPCDLFVNKDISILFNSKSNLNFFATCGSNIIFTYSVPPKS